ncbi:aminotransferase class I/II-fold pyridoxal phosphate-dependent enzyme [Paractinoplanes rhizophilus]|uniref:Aminotransferase class I/II-fold pyridoxal phosphate-dependent enzyme n=1 Tax=Paractinoplanes rhizophilus TaxID=1416877 RepID=A0ABW2HL99_9ACTN|nr:aminotransferase class I/II-fold pyridoxal phosphate-dependent enzyme [Actinoplanes sp.]
MPKRGIRAGVDVIAPGSAVDEAERRYADAVGAREAIFTSCGPAMRAVVSALAGRGGKVLIDRNLHRCVVRALRDAGARPVWMPPCDNPEWHLAHTARAADVDAAMERDPDLDAVAIVTPTAYGSGANVEAIAAACHRRGVPLLVDEAWGTHIAFHPCLPTAAIQAGAEVVTQSVERSGGGRACVVLTGGDLVDPARLRADLEQVTPGGTPEPVLRSIDGFRDLMTRQGDRLLDAALDRAELLRLRLAGMAGPDVLDGSVLGHHGVAEWDPLTVVVDVAGLGVTGGEARSRLRERVPVRLADAHRVVLALPYAENAAQGDPVAEAFRSLARSAAKEPASV